ncbi:MAG: hypothetical protein MUE40_16840 [Anaerolineae bacterium]|jgi:hypothetical protein|nr:hypothetical protein [Anaerolineae bacterium]
MDTLKEIEQALFYLNNRHRLKTQDIPHYLKAQAAARHLGLEQRGGIWYAPVPGGITRAS